MKCARDTMVVTALLLTVVLATAGMILDNSVRAESKMDDYKEFQNMRYDELKINLKEDVSEMKQDIKDIKNYLGVP